MFSAPGTPKNFAISNTMMKRGRSSMIRCFTSGRTRFKITSLLSVFRLPLYTVAIDADAIGSLYHS
ncbi:hypothetical protein NY2A_b609R [Paramecium bursaria Chlorella virus NY2A]|uniref:Uncharacterized protein b609R n=1 Tax=Paramecium bursaria Chlorella virus NY2A TaxID=46021 RepID=A7IXD4_PBCVN|nr:hypothetical protein NY2A_b609R [Paramecium bursaria Chlorella virus NY2A]YP_001498634.1 hypothetical protein AR158_C553R [Paramecium bursaria Chlorella virus AR158]ABT15008.1 hypothetical protein NY2A_b609R [Paramecium bursaria Chlorella virus NY2A]ABU44098.1 hypothetical protein AR158_C553R [Paramecium bursaria Chlorella virus AR158]